MKRREFLAGLGAVAVWPAAGTAQQGRTHRIGILVLGNPDPAPFLNLLKGGLRDLGYVEGQNVQFELRSAGGQMANLAPRAAELVGLKVDVLVAFQTPAVAAAKQATRDIPIVMGVAADPVGTGLVASLARPGGNVTGLSGATAELGAKHLELIRDVLPSARRVAVLANAPDPFSVRFVEHIRAAAKALDMELKTIMVGSSDELEAQIAGIKAWQGQAIVVQPSLPLGRVAELAVKHSLPAFSPQIAFTAVGGLMSYSSDAEVLFKQSASFVDKILKGRKPEDLPVELPTKFLLAINLKTAKAIGLTVPEIMLTRADRVIE